MSKKIAIFNEKTQEFCRRNHIRTLAFFGSVLRDDFRPDSDVDLLGEFDTEYTPSIDDLLAMQEELSRLLCKKVDLVERRAVERSENYIRRRHILQSAETVYVAR